MATTDGYTNDPRYDDDRCYDHGKSWDDPTHACFEQDFWPGVDFEQFLPGQPLVIEGYADPQGDSLEQREAVNFLVDTLWISRTKAREILAAARKEGYR